MNPPSAQTFETVTLETLLDKVKALHQEGQRLVQIGASRLPDHVQLTYSFDLKSTLTNLRLVLPGSHPRIPSITSIYWCAFLYENELHDLFNVQVDGLAVDFQGNFYRTAVKFPFGTTKAPVFKPSPPSAPAPASTSAPQSTTAIS